jgi:hypothetical protein
VQGLPSSTTSAWPGRQIAPAPHVSMPSHGLLFAQDVPIGASSCDAPEAGSHVSTVQGFPSSRGTGVPATQAPASHVSPVVQAFPSLQLKPSAFGGFEHAPVDGSHVPASWHASVAAQTTVLPLAHPPE